MENIEAAYVAGLIDGEGCIHVEVTKGKWYSPRLTVGMTEPALDLLTEMHRQWGGTLRLFRPETEKWAAAWVWYITGSVAENLLKATRPYLRLKREQADAAIRVAEIRGNLPKRTNGQASWTETAREECRQLKDLVAHLNRKGPRTPADSVGVA